MLLTAILATLPFLAITSAAGPITGTKNAYIEAINYNSTCVRRVEGDSISDHHMDRETNTVVLSDCAEPGARNMAGDKWDSVPVQGGKGEIKFGAYCLAIKEDPEVVWGGMLQLQRCSGCPTQQWELSNEVSLRGINNKCLSVADGAPLKEEELWNPRFALEVQACTNTAKQQSK